MIFILSNSCHLTLDTKKKTSSHFQMTISAFDIQLICFISILWDGTNNFYQEKRKSKKKKSVESMGRKRLQPKIYDD